MVTPNAFLRGRPVRSGLLAATVLFGCGADARSSEIEPRTPDWFDAACLAWGEHLHSQISALAITGVLDAPDAAQFRAAARRAGATCRDRDWQGLHLFSSLDRALEEARADADSSRDDPAPGGERQPRHVLR